MRTFTLGSGTNRKFVVIEVNGPRVKITESTSDGSLKRSEKELKSETQARAACERMASALISRGFREQAASSPPAHAKPAKPAAAPKPASSNRAAQALEVFDDDQEPAGAVAPALPRLGAVPGAPPATDAEPKKKKKSGRKKKKRRKGESGDGLDKRVIAAVVAGAAAFVVFIGYLVYDTFLKPPTIVGTWKGSRLDYETGGPMSYMKYGLILDEQNRASMTLQEEVTSVGTYSVKGDRLKLTFKEENGETSEQQYKISLGGTTLDLYDPASGKKMVQLIRIPEKPQIGGGAPPPAAPKDLAASGADKVDKAADARLASVEFSPKDGAFKLRRPQGWEPETGARPDNTYSWAKFSRGSAKIQVFADVTGSLMSGSDTNRQHEEGSDFAPVQTAHALYKKTASEQYSDYNESEPAAFAGSALGEARISAFTASAGDLFGSKLRGYRVTFLTNDRRVTVLCHSPEGDFEKLKPTFLAVCRSVSR